MTASELAAHIQNGYDGELTEVTSPTDIDAWMNVASCDVVKLATYLRDAYPPLLLSTITGSDRGEAIDVIYHFVTEGVGLNVRCVVAKDGDNADKIDSLTPTLPAAILYEREVADLLGIEFVGHPDPRRLILPEDMPEDEHPLRKGAEDEGDETVDASEPDQSCNEEQTKDNA